jgi:hypothetical protein
MDPSHVKKYGYFEIEALAGRILKNHYPQQITIPVAIDLIVERHELIDDIIPIPDLQEKFNVAAILCKKPDGHFDILVDEFTIEHQRFRASFSIAHEFGHLILHSAIFENCKTIDDAVCLNSKIKKSYNIIEGQANYFASVLLMPQSRIVEDTAKIYEFMIKNGNYNTKIDINELCSTLARRYEVNMEPMKIRLKELNLVKKIQTALLYKSPYLDF